MGDYVGLNVGGKIYRTSRLTLTRYPGSFFSSLLDGGIPSDKDDQGNYLIDQDGKIFRHVLNFLRYGELKLPEGFSELGLLGRQADFFLLQALKESIERHVSIGLVFYDGKLFNATKETLSKEAGSFFTKMLKGEVYVSRDAQGNYIMDREGSSFHHVLNYLRDGGIFNTITPVELHRLMEDAKYFGLKVLENHIQSILDVQSRSPVTSIHFYWCLPSPCVAYLYGSSPRLPKLMAIRDMLFNKTFTIIAENVQSGVVNTDGINPNGPASLQDVQDYFRTSLRSTGIYNWDSVRVRVNYNCIRLAMTLDWL